MRQTHIDRASGGVRTTPPPTCALHMDTEMHILEGAPTHRGEEGVAGLELLHARAAHLRRAGTVDGWVFG